MNALIRMFRLLMLLFTLTAALPASADTINNYQLYKEKKIVVAGSETGVSEQVKLLESKRGDKWTFRYNYCSPSPDRLMHLVIRDKENEIVAEFEFKEALELKADVLLDWMDSGGRKMEQFRFCYYEGPAKENGDRLLFELTIAQR